MSERDSSSRQVVWRDGDGDSVAGEHADSELAHLSGGRGEDPVPVVEVHAEHGTREDLRYDAVELYRFFLHSYLQHVRGSARMRGYELLRARAALCRARCAAFDLSCRASLGLV